MRGNLPKFFFGPAQPNLTKIGVYSDPEKGHNRADLSAIAPEGPFCAHAKYLSSMPQKIKRNKTGTPIPLPIR